MIFDHRARSTLFVWLAAICFIVQPAYSFTPPADLLEARELCDKADLRAVEGLWTYPEDDVTVLIYRGDKKGLYEIYVVEAADCSLSPGMKLGELHSSADPDKFTMKLFTSIKKGLLTSPCEAVATFSDTKESLTVKKTSSLNLKFNPNRLLPYFWRIVSISVKSKEGAPEGMVKVYPSYDGNGSSRREPRYL